MAPPPFWIFFLVTWFIFEYKSVVAQVTMQNPLIWQTLVSPYSNNNFDYVSESSSKYYSQDFQTVFAYHDIYGNNERLLINVGDGCHDLTLDDIVTYNNNHSLDPFIQRQQVMGLVSRGGECPWSTKMNTMKKLSLQSHLDMTGVLLYDNVTYPSSSNAVMVQLLPSQQLVPDYWNTTILAPPQRNISNMLDNDLTILNNNNNSNYMAIYFVPLTFAQDMLGKMNNTNRHYVKLAPYFSDRVMDDNPSSSGNSNSNDSDNGSGGGGTDNFFGYGNRGYIAYLIAAGAAIFLAVIIFRWCRSPRFGLGRYRQRSLNDPEQHIVLDAYAPPSQQHQLQTTAPPPCVPIEKLDTICAPQSASLVFPQMKNTVCAICLDDFGPTSIVRLLPCHHGFCVACIDFWLTKKSSLCPICKYDCAATYGDDDDDEHDVGKRRINAPPPTSSSSSTPLVPPPPQPPQPSPSTSPHTLQEHDLGTHHITAPPPYVQSSQTTSDTSPQPPPPSS